MSVKQVKNILNLDTLSIIKKNNRDVFIKQINNLKNKIIDVILDVLRKYSEDNQIDLVLDSSNYILSSNSINITDIIDDTVNSKKIEINFEKY